MKISILENTETRGIFQVIHKGTCKKITIRNQPKNIVIKEDGGKKITLDATYPSYSSHELMVKRFNEQTWEDLGMTQIFMGILIGFGLPADVAISMALQFMPHR